MKKEVIMKEEKINLYYTLNLKTGQLTRNDNNEEAFPGAPKFKSAEEANIWLYWHKVTGYVDNTIDG